MTSTLMGGFRTRDLARPGERTVSTEEMGAQMAEFVRGRQGRSLAIGSASLGCAQETPAGA